MKVLHFAGVINRYDFIDNVLTRLPRAKFDSAALVAVPASRPGQYTAAERYSTQVLNLELRKTNYPRLLLALVREIKRFKPDILHAHHYEENLIAAMAAKITKVPRYILGRHYSDHIYFLARGPKRKILLAMENACNRLATAIIVPSDSVAELLERRQGIKRSKISVIPYGFEFTRYDNMVSNRHGWLRRQYGLEGQYVILACCRLSREKGLDHLLIAMHKIRKAHGDCRLVIIGRGPCESALRQLVEELGIEQNVAFLGWRNDALEWIAAADLIVQPSICESFCQVLIEALALSKPIIMTPVGVAPEVIGRNERGRIIPLNDSQALADAIEELKVNPDVARRLGELGSRYVRANMVPDIPLRRHEQVYETAS